MNALTRQRISHATIAARLRSQPGVWGVVDDFPSRKAGADAARRIRTATPSAQSYEPSGSFEAWHEVTPTGSRVMARYIGHLPAAQAPELDGIKLAGPLHRNLPTRFWNKCEHRDMGFESPCLVWTASRRYGYGVFRWDNRSALAHRVAYEAMVGPVPAGLQLDHLCRTRTCVNWNHLEPVTCRENLLRGATVNARNTAKTCCPQGHPYDETNTYVWRGQRQCRECSRLRSRANRTRRKAHTS